MLDKLTLRSSVASLVKLLFKDPVTGEIMLTLERIATLRDNQGDLEVSVRSKPFGGAVLLTNPVELKQLIGDYQYDSDRSRHENDFRLLIDPKAWDIVKQLCWQEIKHPGDGILDASPLRELIEEFEDTLGIHVSKDAFEIKPRGMIVEDTPVETTNTRAPGKLTVRAYFLFEAEILESDIILKILANNQQYSDQALQDLAWQDKKLGGRGRANAILALPLSNIVEAYRRLPEYLRGEYFPFEGHMLDQNVLAILDEVDQMLFKPYHGK